MVGLFTGRGYNIDSLVVGHAVYTEFADRGQLACITIVTTCDDEKALQIKDQIETLINVIQARIITDETHRVDADITLVKVWITNPSQKVEALAIAQGMRAVPIITRRKYIVFRFIGRGTAWSDFIENMEEFGHVEAHTSGLIAIA